MKFFKRLFRDRPLSLRRLMFFLLFSTTFFAVVAISALWIVTAIKNNNRLINSIEKSTLQDQKKSLKREVRHILSFIQVMNNNYQSQDKEKLKQEILSYLQHFRFGYSGYIFINTFDGKALIFNGEKVKGNKSIVQLTDSKGMRLFPLEIAAAKNPDGGFMRYNFRKMDDTISHPKISFITSYKPWAWIVGAGDYIDDAHHKVESLKLPLLTNIRLKIRSILLLLILMSIFLAIFSDFLAKQFVKQPKLLLKHLHNQKGTPFDAGQIYIKELQEISKELIDIESEKMKVEQALKQHQNHLEEMVKERTNELEEKNKQLESFNELFVNREFRIKELRDEIKVLKKQTKNF